MVIALSSAVSLSAAEEVNQSDPNLGNAAPAQPGDFSLSFRENVRKGCLANVSSSIRKPEQYCECYADSYLRRYTEEDLVLISENALKAKNGGPIVAAMMRPDMRQCALEAGWR